MVSGDFQKRKKKHFFLRFCIVLAARAEKSVLSNKKPYDPSPYSETSPESLPLQEALNRIKLLEDDYKTLHEKRLQDVSPHFNQTLFPHFN